MGVAALLKEWLSGTPATASLEMVGEDLPEEDFSPPRRRGVHRLPIRGKSIAAFLPRELDDAYKAAQYLKAGSAVFVNLQEIDRSQGQRIVDTLAGVCEGVEGTTVRVGDRLFVFLPSDFALTAEEQQELHRAGLFPEGFAEAKPSPTPATPYADEPPPDMRSGLFGRAGFRPPSDG